ncbi:MAG: S4 domain-containing protein, partial [Lachnospiraceae bacterium]
MSTVKHVRLDKFLSDRTAFSRSEIKQKLRRGDVKVNGETIRRPEFKISPDDDDISFQGQQENREVFRYYMLNKPAGVV